MKTKIHIINAAISKAEDIDTVAEYFSVDRVFWKKTWVGGRMRRVPMHYETSLVTTKGIFLAGWNQRIHKFLLDEYDKVTWVGQERITIPKILPLDKLKCNLRLDDFQTEFVTTCLNNNRGLIVSATGSGKTVMEGTLLASYPNAKRLVLCHSKKLLHQLAMKIENLCNLRTSKVGDGKSDLTGDVIVAIIDSWSSQPIEVQESIEVVIVDEAHHVNNENSVYFQTLLKMTNAWCRFGFTATLPSTKEGRLLCEGVFGSVLGKLSIETATKMGIFAQAKVVLLDSPIVETTETKYAELYKLRIVRNQGRNKLLVDTIHELNENNESCLIYVRELEHGKKLKRMIPNSIFVYSKVSGAEQEVISDNLNKKIIMNVIATTTWKEGVDIPELNNVINAAGGMSDIAIIQNIGRAARTTKNKKTMKLYDFIDHGNHLERHTCNRLSIYIAHKWL